jgi:hypothetical protein
MRFAFSSGGMSQRFSKKFDAYARTWPRSLKFLRVDLSIYSKVVSDEVLNFRSV